MYQVLIDGDNISFEKYFENILKIIKTITHHNEFKTTIISQSNLVFKFSSQRQIHNLSIICCNTKNKNATDANILFQAGISIALGHEVIIISNDKIYLEITENNSKVTVFGYTPPTNEYSQNKLRKKTILKYINHLKSINPQSYDVTLDDLHTFFPKTSMFELRCYINSLEPHGFKINSSDHVYIKNH